jgi:hypothetical protein
MVLVPSGFQWVGNIWPAIPPLLPVFWIPPISRLMTSKSSAPHIWYRNLLNSDRLVQACLNQGAYCVIDLHNYGRFDDYLIGQGGATDTAFVALWGALAAKYAKEPYVIFGLMNQISSGDSYIVNSRTSAIAPCPFNLTSNRLRSTSYSHMEYQHLDSNFAVCYKCNCQSILSQISSKRRKRKENLIEKRDVACCWGSFPVHIASRLWLGRNNDLRSG